MGVSSCGYRSNVTVDLMRRRSEVPPGTMDFIFVAMFEHFKALIRADSSDRLLDYLRPGG
jgi:hypothetical protein